MILRWYGAWINRNVKTWDQAKYHQRMWVRIWKLLHPFQDLNPKEPLSR